MTTFLEWILHLEDHLRELINQYGLLVYALLFVIIFCETGLVITPFLPGDSLLFAVGAVAAKDLLQWEILLPLLALAGILGDSVNYALGAWMGPKVFHRPSGWFLRQEYLTKAHEFYTQHGGQAILLARFIPIIRTFAPFVAGAGTMDYRKFFVYNVSGACLWILLLGGGGYFFGNLPLVKDHMEMVILGIIGVSILPILWEMIQGMRKKQ